MSNDKSILIVSQLNAGASDSFETNAIPLNEKWNLLSFGGADINLGDNKSTVYVLRFGTDVLRILSLTGATQEIAVQKEITGDGIKKISIIRFNKSGHRKECPVWLSALKRS